GIVYHANYLRYCERGRSDFLRLLGIHHAALYTGEIGGEQLAFAVRRMEIDFIRPAQIDDMLQVITFTRNITGAALHLEQQVLRNDELLFKALVTAALVNAKGKPKRLPPEIRSKLETVPGKT
ncbi:MAG: acyl-CoA thioesterase, partial [Fimbriimonadaceae bacterium]|nr:acyl-CoA thioesterase [Alphaproteobacteria bacterium]